MKSLERFRDELKTRTREALIQQLKNCEAKPAYAEYAVAVREELDSRSPSREKAQRNHRGAKTTIMHFRGHKVIHENARGAYIASIRALFQVIYSPPRMFQFELFKGFFLKFCIPIQVADGRQLILFNPLEVVTFGNP